MIELSLPIYFTKEFKTKPSKTFLVNLNWFRNAHHFIQNDVKQHFHELIAEKLDTNKSRIEGKYTLDISLYYKNTNCDASNIIAMSEKYVLDALQGLNVVKQDSVRYHVGTTWQVVEQDKDNPRVVIKIKEV